MFIVYPSFPVVGLLRDHSPIPFTVLDTSDPFLLGEETGGLPTPPPRPFPTRLESPPNLKRAIVLSLLLTFRDVFVSPSIPLPSLKWSLFLLQLPRQKERFLRADPFVADFLDRLLFPFWWPAASLRFPFRSRTLLPYYQSFLAFLRTDSPYLFWL